MKKFLSLFLLTMLGSYSHACLWEYRTKLNGTVEYVAVDHQHYEKRFQNKQQLEDALQRTWDDYLRDGKTEDYSDYAVYLVYKGEHQKAKNIFFEIESKTPGTYINAANLGTVYELMGNLDSALLWIKKAVSINPNSHYGSEWIHLKILEAKTADNGNKQFYDTYNILGIDFGNDDVPKYNGELSLDTLFKDLSYQLHERINFATPPDPIMGQLFFQFGNAAALVMDLEEAIKIYNKSKEFGYEHPMVDKRIAYYQKLGKKAKFYNKNRDLALALKNWPILLVLLLIIIIPSIFIILFIVKLIKKKKVK